MPTLRPCLDCGDLSAQSRCPVHARDAERRRNKNRTPRGDRYGREHQEERASWVPLVEAGKVRCRRAAVGQCIAGTPLILPGSPWHLGHPDEECSRPTAPEHEKCNTSAAGRLSHKGAGSGA